MMSRIFLTLTLCTSLSACVSILPKPDPSATVYRLASYTQPVETAANAENIRIVRPTAAQAFNSRDIVVTKDGQKLSRIAESQWSQQTPDLIQNAMIDALESSSQFVGLAPSVGAQSSTRLHLTVKNFEANFDNGPESAPLAVVQYRVTYVRADDRKLLGTYNTRKTMRAESINVSSVVSAMERANSDAMIDIVGWLEGQASAGRS